MPKKKDSFKLRLEYGLFSGLVFLVKHTPGFLLRLEKKALVFLLKIGSPRHSRLITRNLALAFPDSPSAQQSSLKKNIYNYFGSVFMEFLRTFARKDLRAILARARVNHIEVLERALGKKKGVIVFSAHFGSWEWVPLLLRDRLEKDTHIVTRPMDNPLIENKVREFREAMGSRVIYKQGSLRTILKLLKDNGIVCLMIDQNTVEREGIFVDFFGRKAAANTTVSQLYLKKGIPLVPVFLHNEGEEIILDILPEIDYAARIGEPAALAELTQQLTWLVESQVRKFPEQWFWFHNRWKTKPQGEAQ